MDTEVLLHNSDEETDKTIPEATNGRPSEDEALDEVDSQTSESQDTCCSRFPFTLCQIVDVVALCLVTLVSAAMLAGGYKALINYSLHKTLVIKNGSLAYDMWKSTAVPLSLRLHVFNLTNPDEVQRGGKPVVEEVGPYVWREYHEKHNISFHDNNTVTYLQQRWWVWDEEASAGHSQNDTLVTLNAIPVAAAYSMRDSPPFELLLDYCLRKFNESLTVSSTASELVFDGVRDPLLDWIQKNVVAKNGTYHYFLKLLEEKGGAITKFEKFAWFYKRNLSLTYDGMFNMMTGEDTLNNLGKIDNWNGRNDTSFYTAPCNKLTGSAGELFPPQLSQDDVQIFSSDLCMSGKLFFKNVLDHNGLETYRYWGTNETFANGSTVPGNECYCVANVCAPMGLLNVESCRMGAPAFVSFPHFYAGDPFLIESVEGLKPDKDKHSFFLDLVPGIGVPAEVSAKLQINLHLMPNPRIRLLRSVPDVYMPMLWFEVRASMPPHMVQQMKWAKFFLYSPVASIGIWVLLPGVAMVVVLIIHLVRLKQRSEEDDPLLP